MEEMACLEDLYTGETLPNALLLGGVDRVEERVGSFLAHCLQNGDWEKDPDYHLVEPGGSNGMYTIETIRNLGYYAHMPPFRGVRQIFVLPRADKMPPIVANAFLKTLEDPASTTSFLLLSHYPSSLLPTIRSRCVLFSMEKREGSVLPEVILQTIEEFCGGGSGELERLQQCEVLSRYIEEGEGEKGERFLAVLRAIFSWHKDRARAGKPSSFEEIEERIGKSLWAWERNVRPATILSYLPCSNMDVIP